MFFVKKLLGHLLMPLPLALALLTLGVFLAAARRRSLGRTAAGLGWLVLLLASNRGVSIALTASLENHYAAAAPLATSASPAGPGSPPPSPARIAAWPADLRSAAFVAVLGGGHGDATALPAGQRLSPSARARLVEGIRIAIALPDTWLVVSGPRDAFDPAEGDAAPDTHARVLADAAVELGFPRARIVEIDTARDTAEEIAALRRLAGEERVALVTSAWHLPRAMKLAGRERLAAFPCPSDYLGGRDGRPDRLAWFTWDADSLMNTTRAWREYLGRAWAALVAWIRG